MSRRFHDLLERYALVRRMIDAERTHRTPNLMRLARLRALQLRMREALRDFVRTHAMRRASRPRLVYSAAR
jgi:hypothetical protein